MRRFTVLTLTWLPLVLLYTDQRASAFAPDSSVKIEQLSTAAQSCLPPAVTTRSVRVYSSKAVGGTEYVRQQISQALMNCFQVSGGAANQTALDFGTCTNTAETKKKNAFRFDNGVCTTYTPMPPSLMLQQTCQGAVGVAVLYVAKTALNSVTLTCP